MPLALGVDREQLTVTWRSGLRDREQRARRVLHYTGWVALKRSRLDPAAAPDDYVFLQEARWHDQGFLLPIEDGGKPTDYAIELAQLTYQNTRTPILKLGVVDTRTGETLAYSWAEPRCAPHRHQPALDSGRPEPGDPTGTTASATEYCDCTTSRAPTARRGCRELRRVPGTG